MISEKQNNNLNQQTSHQARKKVGLALSGGFIRATAGIGVIEVLAENNIPVDLVSGCSSGAAVAAAHAAGTLDNLKRRLIKGKRREYWQVIFEPTLPKKGFLKGERNRKFFEEFVGEKNFSDLNKELILAATDLANMKEVIIREGKVGLAIQACTAVPGIFVPVKWEDKILIDGGNFNMIPSKVLYQRGADYVIAVYAAKSPNPITCFASNFKRLEKHQEAVCPAENCPQDLNIFQLMWRAFNLSASQIKNFYHDAYKYDALVKPELFGVKRWHVNSVAYCVEQGRKAALEVMPQIKKDLGL